MKLKVPVGLKMRLITDATFIEPSAQALENAIPPLVIKYRNWKGVISIRKIIPDYVFYGATEFHKEFQYLLHAWDIEKKEYRDFAIVDIIEFIKE